MNLKDGEEEYMGDLEGEKRRNKCCNYIIKKITVIGVLR